MSQIFDFTTAVSASVSIISLLNLTGKIFLISNLLCRSNLFSVNERKPSGELKSLHVDESVTLMDLTNQPTELLVANWKWWFNLNNKTCLIFFFICELICKPKNRNMEGKDSYAASKVDDAFLSWTLNGSYTPQCKHSPGCGWNIP